MSNVSIANDENALLQRIVSRLCVAFDGSDIHLDEVLQEIRRSMRRQNTLAELEQLLNGLTDGIRRSDDARATAAAAQARRPVEPAAAEAPATPAPRAPQLPAQPPAQADPQYTGQQRPAHSQAPSASAAAPANAMPAAAADSPGGADPGRAPLLHLVDRLDLLPHLQQRLAELRLLIERCGSAIELQRAANPLAALVNQQRADLQRERNGVTAILEQVASRVEEMTQHLSDTAAMQEAAADDSSQFNSQLIDEFSAIGASARDARDLAQFQQHLSARLEILGAHLRRFRERELARLSDYKARAERMTSRVFELERETHELQERVDREQRRAYTDPLTGIPNRLAFQERIGEEFAHWKRSGVSLCVALWDIDSFKSINDTFGHQAGDKAIRIVAQHLARSVRKSDFVARYGGEEFVMILRGLSAGDAMQHAERARQSLEQLGIHFEQTRIPITASCGVAVVQAEDGEEGLIQRADAALYQAKKAGRNRCVAG
ncbi:MAG: diguanylate cyclase [Nevskia sp.]|nr:diguanylate cyclase [Nevskia sp.]